MIFNHSDLLGSVEVLAALRLDDADVLPLLHKLRNITESVPPQDSQSVLNIFVPWSISQINWSISKMPVREFEVAYSALESEARSLILSILSLCLSTNDYLKTFAEPLVSVLVSVLNADIEANGILALRLIVDLHKSFRLQLEGTVRTVIEFSVCMIDSFDISTKHILTVSPLVCISCM